MMMEWSCLHARSYSKSWDGKLPTVTEQWGQLTILFWNSAKRHVHCSHSVRPTVCIESRVHKQNIWCIPRFYNDLFFIVIEIFLVNELKNATTASLLQECVMVRDGLANLPDCFTACDMSDIATYLSTCWFPVSVCLSVSLSLCLSFLYLYFVYDFDNNNKSLLILGPTNFIKHKWARL